MNGICRCILEGIPLSVDQADKVYNDLSQLDQTGNWFCGTNPDPDRPVWAAELGKYLQVAKANIVVQNLAWRAVAKAYRHEVAT